MGCLSILLFGFGKVVGVPEMTDVVRPKILVVDDVLANLKLLTYILSEDGYAVYPALSGESALQLLNIEIPDLILLDVHMPEMNGYEVCHRIKQKEEMSRVPILFISAADSLDDKVKGFEVGGVDYIVKPFQAEEVLARVGVHSSVWRLHRELEAQNARLSKMNAELESTYAEMARAHQQIIRQEKMASVGQLAAGIAHEINNPLGFVISNIAVFQMYAEKFGKLYRLIQRYRAAQGVPASESERVEAECLDQFLAENDFGYYTEDLKDVIGDTDDGLQRISRIVKSLCRFAQVDVNREGDAYDLNEEIANVRDLVGEDVEAVADIQLELGTLPELHGDPGEICQMILHLLVNARDAIRRTESSARGVVCIRTWEDDGFAKVSIRDSGGGIPPEHVGRIFDPFYTSDPVGKGIGLGLSICYDVVVNRHSGKIEVFSNPGGGTEFIVSLPINP